MEPKKSPVCQDIIRELDKYRTDERKLEFLENQLKQEQDPVRRKTMFVLMGTLQFQRKWFNTAAKSFSNAADLSTTFDEKQDLFFRAGTMFVRSNDFFTAEDIFRKSVVLAPKRDRVNVQKRVVEAYLQFARECETGRQNTKALSIYNRVLGFKISLDEANQIRDKIIGIYEKMGNPIQANAMRAQKKSMNELNKFAPKKEEKECDDEFSVQDLIDN